MRRLPFFVGFLVCAALIGAALYFEHVQQLEPCNLCIFQRLVIIGIGFVLLIAAIHGPYTTGRRVYGAVCLALSLTGIGLAARQLWLQAQPKAAAAADCGAGLEFMLQAFPIRTVVEMVLTGSGDCAEVHKVFGLSIPWWTLLVFVVFGLASLYYLFSRVERRRFG